MSKLQNIHEVMVFQTVFVDVFRLEMVEETNFIQFQYCKLPIFQKQVECQNYDQRSQWQWHLDDQPSCLFLNLDQLGNVPAGKMESVLVVIDSLCLAMSKCTILRLLKEVFAIASTLQSTFKGTRNCHMDPHEFDRPRHLCSKPAQATSSESSTAQSSERPSWSQPWTAAQLLKKF